MRSLAILAVIGQHVLVIAPQDSSPQEVADCGLQHSGEEQIEKSSRTINTADNWVSTAISASDESLLALVSATGLNPKQQRSMLQMLGKRKLLSKAAVRASTMEQLQECGAYVA